MYQNQFIYSWNIHGSQWNQAGKKMSNKNVLFQLLIVEKS
jgi:hypothetical protein